VAAATTVTDTDEGALQERTKEVLMRKVIASEFVSLDGVMESADK